MVRFGDTVWFQSSGTSNVCRHPGAFFAAEGFWTNIARIRTSNDVEVQFFCRTPLVDMDVVKSRLIPFRSTADAMNFLLEWNPDLPDAEKSSNAELPRFVTASWREADEISRSWQMGIFKAVGCKEICDFVYLYRFATMEQLIESNMLGNSLHTIKCAHLRRRLEDEFTTRTRGTPRVEVTTVPASDFANARQEKVFFIDHFMQISAAEKALLKARCHLLDEATTVPPTPFSTPTTPHPPSTMPRMAAPAIAL